MKQIIKKLSWINLVQIAFAFALILSPLVLPQVIHAQSFRTFVENCPVETGVRCTDANIASIFKLIINWALALSFIAAVLVLIYGGFLYITSAGNQDSATKGKDAIVNALIGIVVIVLSYMIVQIVYRFVAGQEG